MRDLWRVQWRVHAHVVQRGLQLRVRAAPVPVDVSNGMSDDVSDGVPATFLQGHPDALVVLDRAAAGRLTRERCPWSVRAVRWDEARQLATFQYEKSFLAKSRNNG